MILGTHHNDYRGSTGDVFCEYIIMIYHHSNENRRREKKLHLAPHIQHHKCYPQPTSP